jgi:hypothetical protein
MDNNEIFSVERDRHAEFIDTIIKFGGGFLIASVGFVLYIHYFLEPLLAICLKK